MKLPELTPMQRVTTSLSHQEPDQVPLFLMLSLHGAKELGLSIRQYFAKAENVVEGQLRLRQKFGHDCFYVLFYASIEIEAWGGEVIFSDDGPPNTGEPFIKHRRDIETLTVPQIKHTACLSKVLDAIHILKEKGGPDIPIIGIAISPFSLPVMQMGFEAYLRLIYEDAALFWRLMQINMEFSVAWANWQLAAGATAICYFDPVSSTTIIPRELYLTTGFEIARRVISRIQGPTATHMASGRCQSIIPDIVRTGTGAIAVSRLEDLAAVKAACGGKIAVIGNLNAIEMVRWTPSQAEAEVKHCIAAAARGGGYILSDNHGEIPFQVTDEVLLAIGNAVQRWGRYPRLVD